jgi:hypothetical protein
MNYIVNVLSHRYLIEYIKSFKFQEQYVHTVSNSFIKTAQHVSISVQFYKSQLKTHVTISLITTWGEKNLFAQFIYLVVW